MFNAHEKAHKAYGWLSMSDVCVDAYEAHSAPEAYNPGWPTRRLRSTADITVWRCVFNGLEMKFRKSTIKQLQNGHWLWLRKKQGCWKNELYLERMKWERGKGREYHTLQYPKFNETSEKQLELWVNPMVDCVIYFIFSPQKAVILLLAFYYDKIIAFLAFCWVLHLLKPRTVYPWFHFERKLWLNYKFEEVKVHWKRTFY